MPGLRNFGLMGSAWLVTFNVVSRDAVTIMKIKCLMAAQPVNDVMQTKLNATTEMIQSKASSSSPLAIANGLSDTCHSVLAK